MHLDVREVQTITVDVNDDGIPDLAISDALADKKQGENESREQEEPIAAKSTFARGR